MALRQAEQAVCSAKERDQQTDKQTDRRTNERTTKTDKGKHRRRKQKTDGQKAQD